MLAPQPVGRVNRESAPRVRPASASTHGVSETASTPPHILGNYPRVELVFQCVDRPSAASATNAAPAAAPATTKYQQLESLKKLLDSGALTQAEFDREKAKVLAGP